MVSNWETARLLPVGACCRSTEKIKGSLRNRWGTWWRPDVSRALKDDDLAREVHKYEKEKAGKARESREGVKSAIERYYNPPA